MKTLLQALAFCFVFFHQAHAQYPPPTNNNRPGISAPGDVFTPLVTENTVPNVPQAAEWTRTAGPDESVVVTGHQFSRYTGTDEGKDTRFMVYGTGGKLKQARIQRIDGEKAIITLDGSLPSWSMYLVWPGNDVGWGAPMTINKTDAWWIGPNNAIRGGSVSIFGRNLAHGNVEGTSNSHIYIKSKDGSGQWATVTKVNPYKVDFLVPTSLLNGEYEVWVHNGHGGEFGWSGPLKLNVENETKWTPLVFNVKDYGAKGDGITDDLEAIKNATLAASNSPGSTVYFPAGVYAVSSNLEAGNNVRWKGDGRDVTKIKCAPNYSTEANALVFGVVNSFEITGMGFDASQNFRGKLDKPLFLRGSRKVRIDNVRFFCQNTGVMDLHNSVEIFITNTELIGMASFLGNCSQLFIDRCSVKLTNDTDMGLYTWGGRGISLTNSTCEDYNNSDPANLAGWGKGRFFTGTGNWGSCHNTYLANNTTKDLTPSPYTDQNTGEQFMWEGNYTAWLGSVSTSTPTATTLNGYTPSNNIFYVVIVKGKGVGQSRRILSTAGNTVTHEPWNVLPDATSTLVVGSYLDRVVVYKNYLDGKPRAVTNPDHIAAAGIEPYGGATNFIADNNTLHELRQGTSNWTLQEGVGIMPNYFSLYSNNTYINCRVPMDNVSNATSTSETGILGTIYRRNIVQKAVQTVIHNNINEQNHAYLNAMVYEHNSCSDVSQVYSHLLIHRYRHEELLGSGGIANQLFYKNSFQGTGSAVMGTSKMAVRENNFVGFAPNYEGTLPDAVVEAPFHVLELTSPVNGNAVKIPFELWNSGVAALNWTATSSVEWLKLSSSNGSATSEKEISVIELIANPQGLSEGVHKGYISITAASQTKVYTVLFTIGSVAAQPSLPSIILSSPTNGSNFTAPANITLIADASDADGSVSKVEFFSGSNKIAEDLTAPYSFSWNGVAEGNYSITAKATDNNGNVATSQNVGIVINNSINLAPTVQLTSPTSGSNFTAPATISLTADALDADGTITKVEFFNGSTKLGEDLTAPYSFSWNGVSEGTYNITAKATDNGGVTTNSQTVVISGVRASIVNLAPVVSLTSPSNGSNFTAPATITLTADASDADGTINKVEFFSGIIKVGEDLTAPYSFSWNGVAEGTYNITAKATDNGGLSTTSSTIEIGVTTNQANMAPSVQFTSPTNGSTFTAPATIVLTADASDIDGTISKVEFFNGSTKLGEDLTAPYSFSWNGVPAGNYFVTAKAIDNGGLTATSQNLHLKVKGKGGNLAPGVQLTSPTNGSNFTAPGTISLTADASDADGTISKVEFFNGSIKLGEDLTAPYSFSWTGVAEGTYIITAKATDNLGLSTTSSTIEIVVTTGQANMAPVVALTSPSNRSNFTAPATITFTADASDADGTISKVEFFNGSNKIGEDLTAPYSFSWNGVVEGTYSITAKATDNGRLSTTSSTIEIAVTTSQANMAPVIAFTSPSNGSNFTAPAAITFTADASDADGTISKVEFFNGSTKLGEDLTAPYSFSWDGVAEGTYSITAKATDNGGLSTISSTIIIAVTSSQANIAPVIFITSPSNGSNFTAPATIILTVNASDGDGTISKVEFFNGSSKLGEDLTAPYSFSWNGVAEGTYSITAKATDNGGLSTTSEIVNISLKNSINLAPTIQLTSPSNGSNFTTPASISLSADASDADGTITKVEFFNGSTKLGEDLTAPYNFSWNGVAEGTYSITAKATDNGGLSTTSSTIDIAVTTSQANMAPLISLTSPSNGSNFTSPAAITLTADASDTDGAVAKVEFFNGSTKLGEDLTAPYNFSWNGVAEGTYSITAKATDNGGLSTTSYSIYFIVHSPSNLAPIVQLTSPTSGSNFTAPAAINLTADASDADGTISKVEFFNGSTKIGEDLTAPYSFSWDGVAEGTYSITAKATDNGGLNTISYGATVTVSPAPIYPAVNLISLTRGMFTAPSNIILTAEASDADGTINKVEFFVNGIKIGDVSSSPYSFSWNNVSEGNYIVIAKATDNAGLTSVSSAMEIVVTKPSIPPTVQMTSPVKNKSFSGPATLTLTADATAFDANVVKVEFFDGNNKLGEDATMPYEFQWTNVPIGSYSLTAKVTDSRGLTATSEIVNIKIVETSKIKIYPNPVSSTATIEFSMPREAYAELQIFNSQGSLISTAFKGVVKANEVQQIKLDATSLTRGVYFCRVIYNDGTSYFKDWLEAKMVVIK